MNCKISTAKLFLFLLLLTLVSCNEPEEVAQDKLVKKVCVQDKTFFLDFKNHESAQHIF